MAKVRSDAVVEGGINKDFTCAAVRYGPAMVNKTYNFNVQRGVFFFFFLDETKSRDVQFLG